MGYGRQPEGPQQQQGPHQQQRFNQAQAAAAQGAVGWGGQAIQEPSGYRVPWFGRNRSKYGGKQYGKKAGDPYQGGQDRFGGPGGAGPSSRGAGEDALSVEEMAVIIQKLGPNEPLPQVILAALQHLDSRAVALLLKDLSRLGKDRRAMELFDVLREAGLRQQEPAIW
ncbi:hypothetical protein HYH03_001269 [Edaphochlamys debaryana]|uniref:Uncharacterized protein n=1 Tax=Edaphochlamys debaryana TaxID=47281 RepID=A0A836C783_9CHLO|nr:hypothetical protein HYH03_001269 [Edaphochlamys debaryana]|eukprot:KAG2501492.1 hypothetical protein HYH03_001269 [Edaphochlamys debaryana]